MTSEELLGDAGHIFREVDEAPIFQIEQQRDFPKFLRKGTFQLTNEMSRSDGILAIAVC